MKSFNYPVSDCYLSPIQQFFSYKTNIPKGQLKMDNPEKLAT
jgi:hypothetical protein